ncbi:adrenocorticotropic hormone receptor [Plakobranchus ocellatus]|uniref:Adrenocorticotropic hormone receptor n=1 Tax=Plakobranchus ocellatus TaxID=259542 RepID=A0AAV3ZXT2_9GAST|nr:adrenocorticotropic hormone receptor [Plakobranchus ocellatus]
MMLLKTPWDDAILFEDDIFNSANISSTSNRSLSTTADSLLGLFDDGVTNASVLASSANATNGTGSFGPAQEDICVMCKYYLQPWLKTLRVGFGSCIVIANIATFIMLLRARTLQLALRYFLLNVAVVDCGYGAGFLYHSAIVDFPQFIVMNFECKLRYGGLCMVSMVALFTLMAMCVERVIALKFAFRYHLIITRTNLLIGIAIFWAVPAAIVTPTYILMDSSVGECNFVRFISAESFVVFSVTYFILMMVAVFCQLVLLFIAKSHIRKILPTIVGDQKKKAAFKMNLKATSTTLSLAVPFVICAAPKVLTYMFLAFNPRERIKIESLTLLAVTVYLNVSNSFINPIVYCYRLPELRAQIMAIFCKRMSSPNTSSDEPMKPCRSSGNGSDESGDFKPDKFECKVNTKLRNGKCVTTSDQVTDSTESSVTKGKSFVAQATEVVNSKADAKEKVCWKSDSDRPRLEHNTDFDPSSPAAWTCEGAMRNNLIQNLQGACETPILDVDQLDSPARGDKDVEDGNPFGGDRNTVKYAWLVDRRSTGDLNTASSRSDIKKCKIRKTFSQQNFSGGGVKIQDELGFSGMGCAPNDDTVKGMDENCTSTERHEDATISGYPGKTSALQTVSSLPRLACRKLDGAKNWWNVILEKKNDLALLLADKLARNDQSPSSSQGEILAPSRDQEGKTTVELDISSLHDEKSQNFSKRSADFPQVSAAKKICAPLVTKFSKIPPQQPIHVFAEGFENLESITQKRILTDFETALAKYLEAESEISPSVVQQPWVITSHVKPNNSEESIWIRVQRKLKTLKPKDH